MGHFFEGKECSIQLKAAESGMKPIATSTSPVVRPSSCSIAVNPAGTKVFIGFYSRQEDTDFNWMIKAYGAKVEVSNGQITANICNFPISLAVFPPLFAGLTAIDGFHWSVGVESMFTFCAPVHVSEPLALGTPSFKKMSPRSSVAVREGRSA